MLELAHWESFANTGQRPEFPFKGITILSGDNRDAANCGAALGKAMGDAFPQIQISRRGDQTSQALVECKNECVELDIGDRNKIQYTLPGTARLPVDYRQPHDRARFAA
jgi:hypothetical protein